MKEIFISSFLTMFWAVGKIFLIAVIAAILVRKKIILQEHIKGLSEILVVVLLPSLIFSNTINSFRPNETIGWWVLPLLGAGIPLLGILLCRLLFWGRAGNEKNVFAVASFPNAAYLVLPLGKVLFPERFEEFSVYCFLFVIGFNIVLWSIGKFYVTKSDISYPFKWKEMITPPLVANVTSVVVVLLGLHVYIPKFLLQPLEMIGSATVPMAIFVLGGTLGGISLKIWPKLADIIKFLMVKYVLVPAIVVIAIYFFDVREKSGMLATLLILEASAAPSTNIIVIMRKYGGDIQQVGGFTIVGYALAIVLMPLWIAFMEILR